MEESILLALSHTPSANLLEDRLCRKGARVVRTSNGEDAYQRIQEESFAVVVAETSLPGRTGLELLRSASPLEPPFVLMGRQGNDQNVIRAFEMNAFDYFSLPFAPEVAAARILRVPRIVATEKAADRDSRVPIPQ